MALRAGLFPISRSMSKSSERGHQQHLIRGCKTRPNFPWTCGQVATLRSSSATGRLHLSIVQLKRGGRQHHHHHHHHHPGRPKCLIRAALPPVPTKCRSGSPKNPLLLHVDRSCGCGGAPGELPWPRGRVSQSLPKKSNDEGEE